MLYYRNCSTTEIDVVLVCSTTEIDVVLQVCSIEAAGYFMQSLQMMKETYALNGCQPWKVSCLPWIQVPLWIVVSLAIRSIVGNYPGVELSGALSRRLLYRLQINHFLILKMLSYLDLFTCNTFVLFSKVSNHCSNCLELGHTGVLFQLVSMSPLLYFSCFLFELLWF